MQQSIRIFNWRLWVIMFSLLICGINLSLLTNTYLQNEDFFGNILAIMIFLGIILMQIISQLYENRLKITPDEFYSASIVKIGYFSQTVTFYFSKLILMGIIFLILGSQSTQFILNIVNGDSLLFALLGCIAMLTWLVFQLYSPDKLTISQ